MGALLTRGKTEMPLGLSVSGASQEKDVLASGSKLSELVKSKGLSSSLNDSSAGGSGELEGNDSKSLRHVEEPNVVGDGSDDGHNA